MIIQILDRSEWPDVPTVPLNKKATGGYSWL